LEAALPQTARFVITPAYYCVTTLSSSFLALKCVLLLLKNNKITTKKVLLLLLHTFAPIFHFILCSFCWRGGRIFLASGRRGS